ncbi:MAG: restriction endonuclease subunit S [Desulfobacteraceae bacterium]|nr:restriction endonuclease subunit S [Desulfobacteraceae bacterium]
MPGRYQKYPEYKDSGVEWLTNIPSQWEVFDGKRIFRNRRELAFDSDQQLAASQKYGVIPQALMMDLNDSKVMLALKGTSSFRHVEKNDFVISLRSFEGGIEHSDYIGCVSPAYTVLNATKKISPSFYRYLFKCKPFIAALQSTTDSLRDGKSITYGQFGSIPLILPPADEQSQIASFLDHKTAKIDILIEKQQQLIKLLKEKRQAVISHAVTNGLNPQAPMKDSGVEWLGEVPEHWGTGSLRWYISIASGDGLSNSEFEKQSDETFKYRVIGGNGTLGYSACVNTTKKVFAIGRVGALCGNVHFINENCWITDNALKLYSWHDFQSNYLYFLLTAARLNEYASKSAQPLITGEQVKSLKVVIPPFNEQFKISDYIVSELTKLSNLIEKCEVGIRLMHERRTALISAAVTGKIDVRNWQAPAQIQTSEEKAA